MRLRKRILIILLSMIFAYGLLHYGFHRLIIYRSFVELEEAEAVKDLYRCINVINSEIGRLESVARGIAVSKDAYAFMQDENKDFIWFNLGRPVFEKNDINILYFIDTHGRVVWVKFENQAVWKRLP